jgi:hypothetical protein
MDRVKTKKLAVQTLYQHVDTAQLVETSTSFSAEADLIVRGRSRSHLSRERVPCYPVRNCLIETGLN